MKLPLKIACGLALVAGGFDARAADRETIVEELIFQAAHAVDTAQTLGIRTTPCRDWFQVGPNEWHSNHCPVEAESAWIIGHHPSDHTVWAFMGAEALLHAGITVAMVHYHAPRWALRTWEASTISIQLGTDAHNAAIGLKLRF